MARFTDLAGRTWDAALTVGHLPVLRDCYGLELGRLVEGEADFEAWLGELTPERLVGVLCELCEPWRDGLTPEQWAARFDLSEGSVAAALAAVAAAVVEFLPTAADVPGAAELPERGADRRPRGPDLERDCWELAGVVGIDPRPLTMRQLFRMATGRRRDQWDHTAAVVAVTAAAWNVEARDAGLNPYRVLTTRPPERSEEAEARRQAEGWKLIETGLRYAGRR